MADIRNGNNFNEEVIVLSSSDEEETKSLTSLGKVSICVKQVNQDNIFPKITCSHSVEEQERILRSRIIWKDQADSSNSKTNFKITVPTENDNKTECHSAHRSNGVSPILSNSMDTLLKENITTSKSIPLPNKLNGSDSLEAEAEHAMLNFLTVCRTYADDEDGHKILQSAKKYYSSAETDFVHSKHFCDFINKKSKDVLKDPQNVFLHIKDVIDELKPYRHKKQLAKKVNIIRTSSTDDLMSIDAIDVDPGKNTSTRISIKNAYNHHLVNSECETSSIPSKKQPTEKQIRRLERLLQRLDRKIKHLQRKELNFEAMDDDESTYIQEDRFKKRFIKVWNKLCSLTGRSTETGREIEKKFRFNGSRYPELNEKISKFVNKRKIFPDYSDVLNLVSSTNSTLKLSDMQLNMLAREVFEEVGKALKMRRCKDNMELIGCFLTDGTDLNNDPANYDADLKIALEENSKKASNDLDQIINEYAQKQIEMKIEPEDVKDDDKSEQSSEEQDENEVEQENERSDVEFIEGTVASDDENRTETTKENNEEEHSGDEKLPPSTSLCTRNCIEESFTSSSNSSMSLSLPSLDLPCTSNSVSSLPSCLNGSKRSWQYEFIRFQAKIPCLQIEKSCLANPKNNETLQKTNQPPSDHEVIILE